MIIMCIDYLARGSLRRRKVGCFVWHRSCPYKGVQDVREKEKDNGNFPYD